MRAVSTLVLLGGLFAAANTGQGLPSGAIAGRPFTARAVELRAQGVNEAKVGGKVADRAQVYVLEFKGTDEFMPDESIAVWFTVEVGKRLDGAKIVCKPVKFGTEAYRAQHFRPNAKGSVGRGVTGVFWNRSGSSDHASDEISAIVQFGSSKSGWIPGSIDLRLTNKTGVRLKGAFKAKIGK